MEGYKNSLEKLKSLLYLYSGPFKMLLILAAEVNFLISGCPKLEQSSFEL